MGDAAEHVAFERAVDRVLQENLLPRLADYVAENKGRLDHEHAGRLRRALGKDAKGFRDFRKIPPTLLRTRLLKRAEKDRDLAFFLLVVWSRLRLDLMEELRSGGENVAGLESGEVTDEDIRLAEIALEYEGSQLEALDVPEPYSTFLELLEELPADADELDPDVVKLFRLRLDHILNKKRAEAEGRPVREAIARQLDELRRQWPDALIEWDDWTADEFPLDQAGHIETALDELADLLDERAKLMERMPSASLAEQVELGRQLSEAAGRLQSLAEELQDLLAGAAGSGRSDAIGSETREADGSGTSDAAGSETDDAAGADTGGGAESEKGGEAEATAGTGADGVVGTGGEVDSGADTEAGIGGEADPGAANATPDAAADADADVDADDAPDAAEEQLVTVATPATAVTAEETAAATEVEPLKIEPPKVERPVEVADGTASTTGVVEIEADSKAPAAAEAGLKRDAGAAESTGAAGEATRFTDTSSSATDPAVVMAGEAESTARTADDVALRERPAVVVAMEDQPVTDIAVVDRRTAVWSLIARRDLEGAFWLSEALEKQGKDTPVPAPLLRSLLGSRWLTADRLLAPEVGDELMETAHVLAGSGSASPAVKALFAAACLVPALKEPSTGAGTLLETLPAPFEIFNPVIETVRSFTRRFQDTLRPVDLGIAVEQHEVEQRIAELSALAAKKLDEAPRRRPTRGYPPASIVFWHLTEKDAESGDNLIYLALAPVAADRRTDAAEVRQFVRRHSARSFLHSFLERLQFDLMRGGHTPGPLQGWAMARLVREIHEAMRIADEWASLVLQAHEKSGDDERRVTVQEMVRTVTPQIAEALDACEEFEAAGTGDRVSSELMSVVAVARIMRDSLEGVRCVLSSSDPDFVRVPAWVEEGMGTALRFRLLAYPELSWETDDQGHPSPSEDLWAPLAERLTREASAGAAKFDDAGIAALIRRWLALEDLRWIPDLLEALQDPAEHEALEEKLREADKALDALKARVPVLEGLVAQAALQATLDPTTEDELNVTLSEISKNLETGRACIPQLRDKIDEIERDLREHARRALDERRDIWETLLPRLRTVLEREELEDLQRAVEDAFARSNSVILDELIAQARRAAEHEAAEPVRQLLEQLPAEAGTSLFEQYWAARDDLLVQLERKPVDAVAADFRLQKRPAILEKLRLHKEQLEEMALAFESWHALKKMHSGDAEAHLRLYNVLRHLGFLMDDPRDVQRREAARDWEYWEASVSVSSPVPEFGSEAHGRIRVLLVSGRTRAEHISTIFRAAGLSPNDATLVLYMGAMPDEDLQETARWAKRTSVKTIVVDEVLLLFLARQTTNRLQALMRCALPASGINPYRPDGGADLAPEMFFGRERQVNDLLDINGPTFVYGGRKLGKSSLLARVYHEAHQPDKNRFSFVIPVQGLGQPGHPYEPEDFWNVVAQHMRGVKELRFRSQARKPSSIVDAIRAHFRDNPDIRLTVLVDEVDDWLTADAERNFVNVSLINQLMTETNRRFRVIFAGVHSVRRFRHIPNQPLVGRAVVVGPLEAREAVKVVAEPMEMLGYSLTNEALLRVLSAVNYHPALLQFFCHALVSWLHEGQIMPPYTVTLADVEKVMVKSKLQEHIQDRFLLTLNLDTHYGVLVRAIVLDQWESRNGFSKAYSLHELWEHGSLWWKDGFEHLTPDQLRGYVDELRDMGVLADVGGGRYRVHSPNLVRLLGTQRDLEEGLERILREASGAAGASKWAAPDEVYPKLIGAGETVYSPLSTGQLRLLWRERSGITLVAGSRATGIDQVVPALRALAEVRGDFQVLQAGDVQDLPRLLGVPAAAAVDAVSGAGGRPSAHAVSAHDGVMVVVPFRPASEAAMQCDLATLREQSAALAGAGGPRWVHIIVLLDTDGIDAWLKLPVAERVELEHAGALTVLRPWPETSLAHLLDLEEVPGAGHRGLYDVTSGYYMLVQEALAKLGSGTGTGQVVRDLKAALYDGDRGLARTLLDVAGLHRDTWLWRLMEAVVEWADKDTRSEEEDGLVYVLADELSEGRAAVASGLRALAYRGLVVSDGHTLTVPPLPYALFKGQE